MFSEGRMQHPAQPRPDRGSWFRFRSREPYKVTLYVVASDGYALRWMELLPDSLRPVRARASARPCPPRAGPASAYPRAKKLEAWSLFAYMVLLNVIRSFWARDGLPENSRPVRGALRNSL